MTHSRFIGRLAACGVAGVLLVGVAAAAAGARGVHKPPTKPKKHQVTKRQGLSPAQPEQATISGVIFDLVVTPGATHSAPAGYPPTPTTSLAGTVTVTNTVTGAIAATQTVAAGSGGYDVSVAPGTYNLSVAAAGVCSGPYNGLTVVANEHVNSSFACALQQ